MWPWCNQFAAGCDSRRYRSAGGLSVADSLDVCGLALSKNPPPLPLVVAFLANDFSQPPRAIQQ